MRSRRSSSSRVVRRRNAEGLTKRAPKPGRHMAIPIPVRRRLDPSTFNLPVEKMRAGYYSDTYFNRVREILERDGKHPRVLMQVFNKKDAVLCGIDEAIAIVRLCSGRFTGGAWHDGWPELDIRALFDGD